MKVTAKDALAAFRRSLTTATLSELDIILDDLHAMQGDPRVNQFKLHVLLGMHLEEVNRRLQQATEGWAAFQTTH